MLGLWDRKSYIRGLVQIGINVSWGTLVIVDGIPVILFTKVFNVFCI